MKYLKYFESDANHRTLLSIPIASAIPMESDKIQDIKDILLELSDIGFYASITTLSRFLKNIFVITIDSNKDGGPVPFNYRDVDDVIMRLFKYFEINNISVNSFRFEEKSNRSLNRTDVEEIDKITRDLYSENAKLEIIRIFISKQKLHRHKVK